MAARTHSSLLRAPRARGAMLRPESTECLNPRMSGCSEERSDFGEHSNTVQPLQRRRDRCLSAVQGVVDQARDAAAELVAVELAALAGEEYAESVSGAGGMDDAGVVQGIDQRPRLIA